MLSGLSVNWILRGALILLAAVFLSACEGGLAKDSAAGQGVFQTTGPAGGGIGGAAAASAQQVFADNASGGANTQDYKIAPLDVIEVVVYGLKDFDRSAQVSTSGMITLPLIKQVKAGGRTTAQLEKEIARKLQATYLQNPQVSVSVKEYNSQKITVDGAVNKPGIYPITGKVSLLQAVALAEGINLVGDPTGVLIFRTENNQRKAARFDLTQVRKGAQPDPVLQAGDIVMVDESRSKTTLRNVKEALPLTGLFQLLLL